MNFIRMTFDWASALYDNWFADWLHIHYLIRTLLLLLMMWLLIAVFTLLFRFILGPLLVLFYHHVILRAWNFLFVETPQEWIYINFYAKNKSFLSKSYLRLSDKAKKNRTTLSNSRYTKILYRGNVRRVANWLMIIAGIIVTLWVIAFGLHHEHAIPVVMAVEGEEYTDSKNIDEPGIIGAFEHHGFGEIELFDFELIIPEISDALVEGDGYFAGLINPRLWPDDARITLALNEIGLTGSRLRDRPGFAESIVIEIIWGDARMEYLGVYTPDEEVAGLFWLRVRSPVGTVGYISNMVVAEM